MYLDTLDIKAQDEEFPTTNDSHGVATCNAGAVVTLNYRTQEYSENGGTADDDEDGTVILAHAIQVGGEYLTLPANGVRWENDPPGKRNQEEDLAPAKLVPTIEHVFTAFRLPELPMDFIVANIGKVNETQDSFFNAPAETLLFIGCSASRRVTAQGVEAWEIEYRFSQRIIWEGEEARGWNHFYRAQTGTWEKIKTIADTYVYESSESFMPLFFNTDGE
jgi:hypothetical protein